MDATTATAELSDLLATAAQTELDAPCWEVLRARARILTAALAGSALVPVHLVVGPCDPPVLVARTLAAVARRLAADVTAVPGWRIDVA